MKHHNLHIMLLAIITLTPMAAHADGQSLPINYDNLSFFEEPLAVELGPANLSTNILIDQSVQYNTSTDDDIYNTRVNADLSLEAQLPTSQQIGVNYFVSYDRLADNNENDEYTDNVAVFISDEWGTLAGGNVTQSVREKTRRKKGFGNANLAGDDFIGALDEAGGYYSVRYNAYEISAAADQEGRAEIGASFEQPIGKSVYFASARLRKGDTTETEDTIDADTYGGAIVGQYTYASFLIAAQAGYEALDKNDASDKDDHVFGSIGTQYKYGAYRVSAEGSIGRYDGEDRRAVALGSMLEIARGASLNFGVNYEYANDDDTTTSIASLRYEF